MHAKEFSVLGEYKTIWSRYDSIYTVTFLFESYLHLFKNAEILELRNRHNCLWMHHHYICNIWIFYNTTTYMWYIHLPWTSASICYALYFFFVLVKTHNIAAIQKIANTLQHKLNEKLRTIADSVTEGLNLEKKTWNDLHQVECDVSRMMSEIDQAVKEAVSIPAVKLVCYDFFNYNKMINWI